MPNAIDLIQSKWLSGVVGGCFLTFVLITTGSAVAVFQALIFLLLPIVCIWYPDAMGRITGISMGLGRPKITEKTAPLFVAIGGWVLLIAGIATIAVLRLN